MKNQVLLFLCIVVFAKCELPGGFVRQDPTMMKNDPITLNIIAQAMKSQTKYAKQDWELIEIYQIGTQVVDGTNYHIIARLKGT